MRTIIRPLALALSLVALAACGDGETTSPSTEGTPVSTESASAADESGETGETAADPAVDIDDFRFVPETITVAAGTEITWTNQDATAHTVTAGTPDAPEPDRFDLEVAEQGDTVSTTLDEPGTYPYFCELHPFMLGTVEVTG
ncbi:MAG: cupredoxin domain-containing protein [Actinobacteria bacterium]|nr:cupredoxin domain-containing protein [Actinomycetota bacterium]